MGTYLRAPGISELDIANRFTVRNVAVKNAQTGIYMQWNWGERIVLSLVTVLISLSLRLDLPRNYIRELQGRLSVSERSRTV